MKFTTNINQLYNGLNAAFIHACRDYSKSHLHAVCLDISKGDRCHVVGTDGHRLAVYELSIAVKDGETGIFVLDYDDIKSLLPVLKKDLKVDYQITVEIETGKRANFNLVMNKASVRLKDEQFPPWKEVVPNMSDYGSQGSGVIGVNPWYLADVVKAFRFVKGDDKPFIKIQIKKELEPIIITASIMSELLIVIMPGRV